MTEKDDFKLGDWVAENWEKVLFRFFGLALLTYSGWALLNSKLAEFASVTGFAVFCFIYANFTKFRKFKGLGFEAELWEDKQAEAAKLVDQLKEIVSIYSREVLMSKVMHGRLYGSDSQRKRWKEIWALHGELVREHAKLGQSVDLKNLKRDLDTYFIFDAILSTYRRIANIVREGRQQAGKRVDEEFGSPITDAAGYAKRLEQLRSIQTDLGEPLDLIQKRELSSRLRSWFDSESKALKAHFDVEIALENDLLERLDKFEAIEALPTLEITDALIVQFSELSTES